MKKAEIKVADFLLQIKSIKLDPANPFTWASGWKSPIYCDNRKTLSYPEIRTYLRNLFIKIIRKRYPEVEVIAGVATGALAMGALIADQMELPFIYVRSKPKDHGLGNQIEGVAQTGSKVVVVEDLVSTGNSSLNAVNALRTQGLRVLGMTAIFTYEFPQVINNFKQNHCELITLSNYSTLIDLALEKKVVSKSQLQTLKSWRKNPGQWNPLK